MESSKYFRESAVMSQQQPRPPSTAQLPKSGYVQVERQMSEAELFGTAQLPVVNAPSVVTGMGKFGG